MDTNPVDMKADRISHGRGESIELDRHVAGNVGNGLLVRYLTDEGPTKIGNAIGRPFHGHLVPLDAIDFVDQKRLLIGLAVVDVGHESPARFGAMFQLNDRVSGVVDP